MFNKPRLGTHVYQNAVCLVPIISGSTFYRHVSFCSVYSSSKYAALTDADLGFKNLRKMLTLHYEVYPKNAALKKKPQFFAQDSWLSFFSGVRAHVYEIDVWPWLFKHLKTDLSILCSKTCGVFFIAASGGYSLHRVLFFLFASWFTGEPRYRVMLYMPTKRDRFLYKC
jgi:hypothetical protein